MLIMRITSIFLNVYQRYRFICVLTFLCVVSSPVQAGMIDKEGMAPWEICGLCHSLDGVSVMAKFPKLAGQKAAYIKKQFIDFHQEIRTNDGGQMVAITTEVDMQTVDAIADYFSGLNPPSAKPKGELESDYTFGMTLFNEGKKVNERKGELLPACVSCHGFAQSSAPWLYAQHSAYILKQLRDFASEERRNDEGNVMRKIASMLSESEMSAIADYLAVTQPRLPD